MKLKELPEWKEPDVLYGLPYDRIQWLDAHQIKWIDRNGMVTDFNGIAYCLPELGDSVEFDWSRVEIVSALHHKRHLNNTLIHVSQSRSSRGTCILTVLCRS